MLGTRAIFKRKIGKDRRIEKYKCRFVSQGLRQTKGIHYDKSSSPTPPQASIRMVLDIAAVKDWELRQLDLDMAYPEANVKEELYTELPEDYRSSCNQVGRLQKSICGLVRAGLLWSKTFSANSPFRGSRNVRPTHACSGEYCAGTSSSSSWHTSTTCWWRVKRSATRSRQ